MKKIIKIFIVFTVLMGTGSLAMKLNSENIKATEINTKALETTTTTRNYDFSNGGLQFKGKVKITYRYDGNTGNFQSIVSYEQVSWDGIRHGITNVTGNRNGYTIYAIGLYNITGSKFYSW